MRNAIQEQIKEIDYAMNSLVFTQEYINACLLDLLKERERLNSQLDKIKNIPNKVGFKLNQEQDGKTQ